MAVVVAVGVIVAVFVEEHRGGGGGGCFLAEVVGLGLTVGGAQEQEPAPPDVSRARVGDREGEGRGHRGVHRAASVVERAHPHFRGQSTLRNHHAPAGPDHLSGARERGNGKSKGDKQGSAASLQ